MEEESVKEPMQESWVEVKEQQEGGTLTHTSSKQELKQMLASAASEEEEVSDSELYQVNFSMTQDPSESEEVETAQVSSTQPPSSKKSHLPYQYQPQVSSVKPIPVSPSSVATKSQRSGICSLSLLVPVIILTHIAMFGIGYYLGRRWSSDGGVAVMKVFHV